MKRCWFTHIRLPPLTWRGCVGAACGRFVWKKEIGSFPLLCCIIMCSSFDFSSVSTLNRYSLFLPIWKIVLFILPLLPSPFFPATPPSMNTLNSVSWRTRSIHPTCIRTSSTCELWYGKGSIIIENWFRFRFLELIISIHHWEQTIIPWITSV